MGLGFLRLRSFEAFAKGYYSTCLFFGVCILQFCGIGDVSGVVFFCLLAAQKHLERGSLEYEPRRNSSIFSCSVVA